VDGDCWRPLADYIDVGYSIDPVHHVQASAEIVLEEGIKGFRKSERDQIIQIMLRHSGKISASGAPKRVLQLAAFLRIGDGLDYSHAQTARIVGVRRAQRTIFVTVHCEAFPQCLTRADRKAISGALCIRTTSACRRRKREEAHRAIDSWRHARDRSRAAITVDSVQDHPGECGCGWSKEPAANRCTTSASHPPHAQTATRISPAPTPAAA